MRGRCRLAIALVDIGLERRDFLELNGALHLPFPQGIAHDFTGGGVVAGVDGFSGQTKGRAHDTKTINE